MRNILAMLTANPVFGVLAGALTTAVLQSSSATTVMVIGFVSAGLMKLPQAISVILGANNALGLPDAPASGEVLSNKVTQIPRLARA